MDKTLIIYIYINFCNVYIQTFLIAELMLQYHIHKFFMLYIICIIYILMHKKYTSYKKNIFFIILGVYTYSFSN